MTENPNLHFRNKHPRDAAPDPRIEASLQEVARSGEVTCAAAHGIARRLGVLPADVGRNMDLIGFRIARCQLGLFGYRPNKRIAQPAENVSPETEARIRAVLVEGRLSCIDAWEAAEALGLKRLSLAEACEALKIRIVNCQLGAF
ncbi:MAG: hypothetical protein ACOWWM_17845 [Desulfobacterales bacterium]